MVANPLSAAFAQQAFGIQVTWANWAIAALVPGTLAILAIPLMFYINPPEIK